LIPQYYSSENTFEQIHHELKLFSCPFCHVVGFLILHGFLSGYSDAVSSDRTRRGHRIFCSNRKRRNGCGRTCSIILAHAIKHFVITAHSVWQYLKEVASGACKAKTMKTVNAVSSQSAPYNLWRTLRANVFHIRTSLLKIIEPPCIASPDPEIQTIRHLKAAFSSSANPIIDFQLHFQVSIFACPPPRSGLLAL
jgi:hypothetical protein